MAEVFEGEIAGELGFVRKVAIKRMLGDAARDPVAARRFVDEARIASRLHHANIVSVLDVGLLDDLPFQVLELVDGLDVQRLMQRAGGALPLPVALIVAADVAHALDHAHGATDDAGVALGIVHRDVKPSNVLVSWSGDVKLTDFGIAIAHDRTTRTEAGVVAGTFGFMAPEQRTRGAIDGRSDVFSLGLALHAMVAGYTPLRDVAIEIAAIAGERIAIDELVPADVAAVIAAAIEPDRRARPTAGELARRLDALVAERVPGGDRRGALRELLARVREPGEGGATPKRGALDQLLGLDVVPVAGEAADGGGGGASRYELRPAAAPTTSDEVTSAEVPSARRRRRARVAVLAVVGTAAAIAGGVALWESFPPAPRMPEVELSAAPIPLADARAAADAQAAVIAVDAAPVDAAYADADARIPNDAPARKPVVPPRADAAIAAAPPPPAGTGYLQVVGDDLVGARVVVDNALAGYAPAKLELARGRHTLVVTKQDGSQLPAKTIEITDRDTFAAPLRPAW